MKLKKQISRYITTSNFRLLPINARFNLGAMIEIRHTIYVALLLSHGVRTLY